MALDAPLGALGNLQLGEGGEEACGGPALLVGAGGVSGQRRPMAGSRSSFSSSGSRAVSTLILLMTRLHYSGTVTRTVSRITRSGSQHICGDDLCYRTENKPDSSDGTFKYMVSHTCADDWYHSQLNHFWDSQSMTFRPAFEPAVERGQGGPARLRLPLSRDLQVGQRNRLLVAMFPSVNGYFFIPNLRLGDCSNQLRSVRHYADRPVRAEPLVHATRSDRHHRDQAPAKLATVF